MNQYSTDITSLKSSQGFTLAEVLVVVVIVGISAAIVIPMISDTTDLQAGSAARQVVSTLLYAQTESISKQNSLQVVFDSGGNQYEVQDLAGNIVDDPVIGNSDYRVDFADTPHLAEVSLTNVNFDGVSNVWFDKLGAPYTGNPVDKTPLSVGEVALRAGDRTVTVTVEPVSGRINVVE